MITDFEMKIKKFLRRIHKNVLKCTVHDCNVLYMTVLYCAI